VQIWKDGLGRTGYLAPPQQRPFFQGLSYDQLYAQVHTPVLAMAAAAGA
jgi:hypothetical protein